LELQSTKKLLSASVVLALSLAAGAQTPALTASRNTNQKQQRPAAKLTPQQKFVIDTVQMAVALPQPDPQDRLRVLSTAADVVATIDRKMAKNFWHEGVRIESDLINVGQTPAVSMMSTGEADCDSAESFVENLPPGSALQAEQSLIGALTSCSKQTLDSVSRKLDAAMQKNVIPSRALMAAMEAHGDSSAWSQEHFGRMFASLPDPTDYKKEAENFAAMYAQVGPQVNKDVAQKAGLELLDWLGKLEDSPLRGMAIRITSGAMQQTLGDEGYQKALSTDVVANSVVQNAGPEREIERPQEETVSVLEAMKDNGIDESDKLQKLPARQRAREAAAHGFAVGTAGQKQQAAKYFDIAFSAVDEAWDKRTPETNTAALVQEVGEAAAQVDSIKALTRAQKLRDTSAQAIAMLAVARVVASNGIAR
jgi:ribosomal protein S20